MGVVFFPSCLPFMGVMLFPSFALGNAYGEGGASLVPLSLFSVLLSLLLLSSPSPSLSFSFPSFLLFFHISFSIFPFLPHKLFPSIFFFFSSFPFIFISFSFFLPEVFFFFFFEGIACTMYPQDVRDDTSDCN